MRSVFLAPHSDDETLFGAFTIMRYQPLVVICKEEGRGHESRAALRELGHSGELVQWSDIGDIASFAAGEFERIFAPMPEPLGNIDHNRLGMEARARWGDRVTHYLTYSTLGKSTDGTLVPYDPGWISLKLKALSCYISQHEIWGRAVHFLRDQNEYVRHTLTEDFGSYRSFV